MNDTGERKVYLGGGSFLCLCIIAFFVWVIAVDLGHVTTALERLADGVYVYVVK